MTGIGSGVEDGLREQARALGFGLFGITKAAPSDHASFYRDWVAAGRHGTMGYLARSDAVSRRADLRATMEDVRSVVVVGHEYHRTDRSEWVDDPARAVVARYARGEDYHDVIRAKLSQLLDWLDGSVPGGVRGRAYVDTGPILERELARRAGLGWFGRNTMLINPGIGSYFLLGTLLVDADLRPDEPFESDLCGSCSACLEACPTGALLGRDEDGAPVMDARRCISYLTIELRGSIPAELRPAIGGRVFGCDICQEVCPWSKKFGPRQELQPEYEARAWPADRTGEPPLPALDGPDLVEFAERLLAMSGREYRRVFAASPLERPGRSGMLRNLCVGLGNLGATSPEAAARVRPVLARAARDRSELVREHAEWGLRACCHDPKSGGADR